MGRIFNNLINIFILFLKWTISSYLRRTLYSSGSIRLVRMPLRPRKSNFIQGKMPFWSWMIHSASCKCAKSWRLLTTRLKEATFLRFPTWKFFLSVKTDSRESPIWNQSVTHLSSCGSPTAWLKIFKAQIFWTCVPICTLYTLAATTSRIGMKLANWLHCQALSTWPSWAIQFTPTKTGRKMPP